MRNPLLTQLICEINFWFLVLLQQIISYDSTRGGVSVITEKGETTTSFLLIQRAKSSDSGKYTCNPSNAQPKSIAVHVLNGEDSPSRSQFSTYSLFHYD